MPRQSATTIASVRRFNRFYTRQLGLLEKGLLGSDLSLSEARVLYELAQRARSTAGELAAELRLDAGYFSRLLRRLERDRYVERRTDVNDGRRHWLSLSRRGRALFSRLDTASRDQVAQLLRPLGAEQQAQLLHSMGRITRLLDGAPPAPIELRDLRPGDIGWIAHRQGQIYATEYGWDMTYEALAAEILAGFVRRYDASRDGAWVAEQDGEIVGSVFLVQVTADIAKLRLLYVEPRARGTGLGRRLVDACITGARARGYRTLSLWTNDVLVSARRIYQAAGFRLLKEEPLHNFGRDLVSQTWELPLQ